MGVVVSPFRVRLWDTTGTGRGRGDLKAIIDDAKNIGGSEDANAPGDFFMTLPYNHPQIAECLPLLRHYEVSRHDGTAYQPIFHGLLNDYDATANEVVFYGQDYLSLFNESITGAATSYANTAIHTIITDALTNAISQYETWPSVHSNSRLGFMGLGTIDTTTETATVLSAYEPRLDWMRRNLQVLSAGTSTRPIVQVSRTSSSTFTVGFNKNQGSDQNDVRLEYGANVNDFRYVPGFREYTTDMYAIGQKREGATILYSHQSSTAANTYGWIQRGGVYLDQTNQVSFDDFVKSERRDSLRIGKTLSVKLKSGVLAPWDGYDLGDSLRVVINRGPVAVDALYTLWGLAWVGRADGSEELTLSLQPKDV